MDKIKELITEYIDGNMSEKRKLHTYGVVREARKLAALWGENPDKAELAALFHDMFRGLDDQTLNGLIREFGIDSAYENNSNLSHGKIAAVVMCRDYGIKDADMINAVSFHTTGRAGMSLLEKILYAADAIEQGRTYPEAAAFRKAAYEDLDTACLMILRNSILYVEKQGAHLDKNTTEAKDYLEETNKSAKGELMTNKEIALKIAAIMDAKKAKDVLVMDIGMHSSFADYFVIGSGATDRQVGTLADEVNNQMAKEGILTKNIEGKKESGWILLDYGDIIVNVFSDEQRSRYNIEKIWGDCETIFADGAAAAEQ